MIGRSEERTALEALLDRAAAGNGRLVAVCGEQGVGKSRLVAELGRAARDRRMSVLAGRAAERATAVRFRPLTEALLAHYREQPLPDEPSLRPFEAALGLLMPGWRTDQLPVDVSPPVVGEALLRLLRHVGQRGGCLLVLDDVQWADPETVDVLEYIADQLGDEPVLCVIALRSGEAEDVDRLVQGLHAGRIADRMDLGRLSDDEVRVMMSTTLEEALDPEREALLVSRGDGLPFVVEELLSAVAAGADPESVVPASISELVTRRVGALGQDAAALFGAAAVIGASFDLALAAATAGVGIDQAVAVARAAIAQRLLAADAVGAELVHFRHALTRDAVLASLLPPERRALAARALAIVEERQPQAAEAGFRLAADLAEKAGDAERAARLLLAEARRTLAEGALGSARALLDRAGSLVPATERRLTAEIHLLVLAVTARAGETQGCMALGTRLLASPLLRPSERVEVHLELARVAVSADDWSEAEQQLGSAEHWLAHAPDPVAACRIDVLAAHLAREAGQPETCQARASAALAASRRLAPDVACEALHVLGREARTSDLERARASFLEAAALAEASGLTVERIRSLFELGTLDLLDLGPIDRLEEAVALARSTGALATVVAGNLQIAWWWEDRGAAGEMLAAARAAGDVASRLGMRLAAAMAATAEAAALAQRGQSDGVEESVRTALALGGDDPDVVAAAHGHGRATLALVCDDRTGAIAALDRAADALREAGRNTPMPMWGLRALLRAVQDQDVDVAIGEAGAADVHRLVRAYLDLAAAVVAGRAGDRAGAEALFAAGTAAMRQLDWLRSLAVRHVAEAALADGWGDPAAWLADAVPALDRQGTVRVSDAARAMSRAAGRAPARRAADGLPAPLAALGVTAREFQVLDLLGKGASTREIADALYLSPKTVERHVENLIAKTATGSRRRLVVFAATRSRSVQE